MRKLESEWVTERIDDSLSKASESVAVPGCERAHVCACVRVRSFTNNLVTREEGIIDVRIHIRAVVHSHGTDAAFHECVS